MILIEINYIMTYYYIIIRYKNKFFNNEKELKLFFKSQTTDIELKYICRIYVTIV